MDIYGWAIPPKHIIFPHLAGVIIGFGNQGEKFDQFQKHDVQCPDALGGKGKKYDLQIFSIVKIFNLLIDCNPSVIDSLYVPLECVLHSTQIGNLVRENRHIFISKRCWPRYKGYAISQLGKIKSKSHHGLMEVRKFEEKHGISQKITLCEVEKEMKKRGLLHR